MLKMKRMIAVVLVICTVLGCIGIGKWEAAASESTEFTELTLIDFGLDDGNITETDAEGVLSEETLDGKAVVLNITFPDEKSNYFYIGGKNKGIRFEPQGDGKIRVSYGANTSQHRRNEVAMLDYGKAGVTSLVEQTLKMKVTFDFADKSTTSTKTDLNLGIYFNDNLYSEQYFTVEDCTKTHLQQSIYLKADTTIGVASIEKEPDPDFVPEVLPKGLKPTTFSNYGFADGKVSWKETRNAGTIVGTIFSGYVTFTSENEYFQFGGAGEGQYDTWKGMRFAVDGNKLTLSPSAGEFAESYSFVKGFAKTELVNNRILLQITTEAVEHDEDGEKNDVKLGIWFNGVLYRNQYIYMDDCVDNFGNNFSIVQQSYDGNSYIEVESYVEVPDEPEIMPNNLVKTTFNDLGIANGKTSWAIGFNEGSVVGTVFSGYITFSGTDMWLQYGGKGTEDHAFWYGMRFACDGTNITLSPSNGEFTGAYTFTSEKAGTELIDNRFLLQITTEAVDYDDDGAKDDVKLGVWFNSVLYNNLYIYMVDSVDNFGKHCALIQKDQNFDAGHVIVESYVQKSDKLEVLPTDLPIYTFTDYNVEERTTNWLEKLKSGTIVDSMFAGYFTVTGNIWFQYGGKGDESHAFWYGIRMNFDGEKIILSSSNGEFRGSYTFTSDVAGTALYDNRFLLQLTTIRCDSDNDGLEDDVQLGVWFNGILYDNTYIYLVDAADRFGRNLGVLQPDQKPALGHAVIEPVKKKVDLSRYGFDNNWVSTLGLK